MTVIAELYASRSTVTGANPSATLMYMVSGTTSEPEVRLAVLNEVPPFYEHPLLQLKSTKQHHMGNGVWQCQADYGFNENRTTFNPTLGGTGGSGGGGGGGGGSGGSGDGNVPGATTPIGPHIRISIGTKNQHVTQALRTVGVSKKITDPDNSPDFQNAIAVGDGSVAGADIVVPHVTWSETWTFSNVYVTWGYIDLLDETVGRVNHDTFRGRAAGEVMFMGAEIDPSGFEGTKIVYNFHREINLASFKLIPDGPNAFDPVPKQGHQLAWAYYQKKRTDDARFVLPMPKALYVVEVGRDSDRSFGGNWNARDFKVNLGIGS